MELRDYLRVLRQRWLIIVVTTLIAVGIAAAVTIAATPQYQSTARMFITTPAQGTQNINAGSQFSQERVKSYAVLIKDEAVLNPVIKKLGLDTTASALAARISTNVQLDTVLLEVSVTDPKPARAQQITQAVATEFVDYVRTLETSDTSTDSVVKVTITNPAAKPTAPVSPQPVRNIGLGLILGLLLGFGIAVLREVLDNKVKTIDDIAGDGPETPLLGTTFFEKKAVKSPLISSLSNNNPRVESYRVLRTNLNFVDPGRNHNVYVVTSSLPVEGKSSTAANLAYTIAQGAQRVLLIEADLRKPVQGEYFGVEAGVGLTTVLLGHVPLDEAVQEVYENFDLLTAGPVPPNPAELLSSDQMGELIGRARAEYDVVIIDTPPLLPVTDAAILATRTDGAILVARYGHTSTDQVQMALDRLRSVGARVCGVIINFVPQGKKGGYDYGYGYGYGYGYKGEDDSEIGKVDEPRAAAEVHGKRALR